MKLHRITIYGLLILAIFFTISNTLLDLHNWYQEVQTKELGLSEIFRFGRTFFIALVVFILYFQNKFSPQLRWLSLAFVFAVVADAFLVLAGRLGVGIMFFIVMQIVLLVRHTPGLQFLKFQNRLLFFPFLLGLFFYFCFISSTYFLLKTHPLRIPIYIYGALLILSCVSGYLTKYASAFSRLQSIRIFWGMFLFLLCDITVLLPVILPELSFAQFSRSLTGLFYTPSLLLLAWSGTQK
ncbi:MAG: hypothetical protein IPM42_20715 [Saprospiraceae bacterium]|nr:hypothetical protein [Saprospiraceae bacterium]